MNIIIKATGFELTPPIQEAAEKKLSSIAKFIPPGTEPVELRLEIGLTSKHHAKGDIFRAEANLLIHNDLLRVESCKEDLMMAITDAKDELQEQIRKYKGKQADAGRDLKKTLRG